MKLRVETCDVPGGQRGAIVEYEGEGALELAKLVLSVLVHSPATELTRVVPPERQESVGPLKVLDWGKRLKAAKVVQRVWDLSWDAAKKWVEVAPIVVGVPPGASRAEILKQLRAAGVEVE